MIRAGGHELVVTGGMESMSNAPYLLPKARFGYRLGNGEVIDHVVFDGLTSTFDGLHMVEQASKVARELGISREEQDEWAYRSHQRAAAAQDAGRFDDEIVAVGALALTRASVATPPREASFAPAGLDRGNDDSPATLRCERRLFPCVTVCSEELAQRKGLEPLATILAQGYVADDYAYLARTPARAGEQALSKAGAAIGDVKRIEINEAFSSVAKNSTRMLGADEEIVNVNGGAVALGHPIGASGGRIVTTLVHELRRNGGGLGLPRSARWRTGRRASPRGLERSASPNAQAAAAVWREGPLLGDRRGRGASDGRLGCCVRVFRHPASSAPPDQADAAIVGQVVAERTGEVKGEPVRLLSVEVDQHVKGHLGNTIVVRSPSGSDCDLLTPMDKPVGLFLTRAPDGTWLGSACSVVAPGPLIAEGGEPRGGAIKVVVGVVILALVLLCSLRRAGQIPTCRAQLSVPQSPAPERLQSVAQSLSSVAPVFTIRALPAS